MKRPRCGIAAGRSPSHPVRGAWIEIWAALAARRSVASHPVRGAWIEIEQEDAIAILRTVAPREGCVD